MQSKQIIVFSICDEQSKIYNIHTPIYFISIIHFTRMEKNFQYCKSKPELIPRKYNI